MEHKNISKPIKKSKPEEEFLRLYGRYPSENELNQFLAGHMKLHGAFMFGDKKGCGEDKNLL